MIHKEDMYGDVPLFMSGSSIYGHYSLVTFDVANKKMTVKVYDATNGDATVTDPDYPLKDSYDLK